MISTAEADVNPFLEPGASLATATAALLVVLAWRFTNATKLRDVAGIAGFVAAIGVTLAGGLGLVPGSPALEAAMPVRLAGAAGLVGGLLVSGASFSARRAGGTGVLCTSGIHARLRQPLHVGLGLALVGNVLRTPTLAGALAVAAALGLFAWLARAGEREAAARFGLEWETYAKVTPALWPRAAPPGGAGPPRRSP